jgi:Dehydrogenases (flavoproteins)
MDQFDIIVIGGGSAGSAAAGRLAEDGRRRVCLVEAGGTNGPDPDQDAGVHALHSQGVELSI